MKQAKGKPETEKTANIGRHQKNCTVCAHPQCGEIEAAFVSWQSPAKLATEYELADRSSIYRHAHAMGLFEKRRRNVRAALERIIERSGDVDVTASAVVAAVQAYSKINAAGEWVDRTEDVTTRDLFDRMSREELENYAKSGTLPAWFTAAIGATGSDSQER